MLNPKAGTGREGLQISDDFALRSAATPLHQQLAGQILRYLHGRRIAPGTHLSAQSLANEFHVSRSPIHGALRLLGEQGVLKHKPQRGYFVSDDALPAEPPEVDALSEVYLRIAEDRLQGRLPQSVSEAALRERYGISSADVKSLTGRMLQEGWIERRRGYGWRFGEMLTTPDALAQTYRLRAALEPAALLEPTFRISAATLDSLAETEQRFLDGEIETAASDTLYARGVVFHETLAKASGNPYIFDALRRVNQIRRLLAYRSMTTRKRFYKQAAEHLEIVELIRRGRNDEAAVAMRHHLGTVVLNLQEIEPLLRSED